MVPAVPDGSGNDIKRELIQYCGVAVAFGYLVQLDEVFHFQ